MHFNRDGEFEPKIILFWTIKNNWSVTAITVRAMTAAAVTLTPVISDGSDAVTEMTAMTAVTAMDNLPA